MARRRARTRIRRPRGTLSRAQIIEGAFRVAERMGVACLSMPALAEELEVAVTSLYWYFHSRDELLDAATERAAWMVHEALPAATGEHWEVQVRRYWTAYHAALCGRPVLADLTILRAPSIARSQGALQAHAVRMEGQLEALAGGGFGAEEAIRAYAALSVFTRGCIMAERLDGERPAPFSDEEGFASGIDVLVAGLRRHHAETG
ncbi:MAG: TetR family transcriptional regulator [Actinomycetia bacterium]|nr:TetR family transcriptional regulator [Actinomycetes bacterium]